MQKFSRLEFQLLRACPDLPQYVTGAGGDGFTANYVCNANWKIMIDNALECYHCQTAHREFSDMVRLEDHKVTLYKNFTYFNLPIAMKSENKAYPIDLDHDVLTAEFWWIFQNILLGRFPGVQNFYVSRFDPLEVDKTSRVTVPLKPREATDAGAAERERLRSIWTANVVSAEDQALCENVQRGMRTAFSHGWYVTDPNDHAISEHAMRYFHDLYRSRMDIEPLAAI
ncbi:SRPBCC family protein [Mesorhizobium abyssinicae]|uniref:SRPBCC family protein n=1 Tax=Mesorhizobium abyssinicae TaxID=1209958 RepID=UPI003390E237